MSKNPPQLDDYSPALRSLLPMLFAAWSDAVLTPSEIKFLREKVAQMQHLTPKELELIHLVQKNGRISLHLKKDFLLLGQLLLDQQWPIEISQKQVGHP